MNKYNNNKLIRLYYIMASLLSSSSSLSSSSLSSSSLIQQYSSICKPFNIKGNTLLVASSADPAGVNMYTNLISKDNIWIKENGYDNIWYSKKKALKYNNNNNNNNNNNSEEEEDMNIFICYLWMQDERLLNLNEVDEHFLKYSNINCKFDDIIFLSMHRAASGKPSLTVHPIGVPWQTDVSWSGGLPGRCSPPSLRIASLYRTLYKETKRRSLDSKYQVTLEATHHGPYVSKPVCFFEIGSTEEHWSIPECGNIMADIIISHLGLYDPLIDNDNNSNNNNNNNDDDDNEIKFELVMNVIGGGHYVPKQCDGGRLGEGLYTGHAITTYALEKYFDGTIENPVQGGWQSIINESIDSTKISFPSAEIVYYVDKKAFLATDRHAICSFLDSKSIKWSHSFSDIKEMYDKNIAAALLLV